MSKKDQLENLLQEVANLLAWENCQTKEGRKENGKTPKGRTINALYYAHKEYILDDTNE